MPAAAAMAALITLLPAALPLLLPAAGYFRSAADSWRYVFFC